ncbi:uncharacterized protein [Watersipora subatra]|uniref:uncharacterized protein isoform X2 n=1 Tax=Watersipora subatra TaxID=2589382 RepID=UPI00355B5F10
MGNSGSAPVSSSGAVEERIKKEKKRCKKFCCFCIWCNLFAIAGIVVGIGLMATFINKKDAKDPDVAEALGYTGVGFLVLGFILLLIGVIFAVALYSVYQKLNGKRSTKVFKPPQYAHGTAPYPQQDWGENANPHEPEVAPIPPPYSANDEEQLITPEIH